MPSPSCAGCRRHFAVATIELAADMARRRLHKLDKAALERRTPKLDPETGLPFASQVLQRFRDGVASARPGKPALADYRERRR